MITRIFSIKSAALFFTALFLLCIFHVATAATVPVYWVEGGPDGRLGRVNLDGSGFQTLLTGLGGPTGIDIDPINQHIYWTEPQGLNNGKIRRANLDGSGIVDVVTGLAGPAGISLDLSASKIYWTNGTNTAGNPTVQRSNFDGSSVQTLIAGLDATAIEVDSVGGKIYWTAGINSPSGSLMRANLDGTSPQTLFTSPTVTLYGVTVGYDSTYYPLGRVYFSQQDFSSASQNTLQSIDLAGGATTTVASHAYPFYGVDFDPMQGRVLWANIYSNATNSGEISGSAPDGSLLQLITSFPTGRQVNDVSVWPLATIPEPSIGMLLGTALASCLTAWGLRFTKRRASRRA
jgi:hypothetical protein